MESKNRTRVEIDETNIAHSVDKNYKFKLPADRGASIAWLNITDEHVMVWY